MTLHATVQRHAFTGLTNHAWEGTEDFRWCFLLEDDPAMNSVVTLACTKIDVVLPWFWNTFYLIV